MVNLDFWRPISAVPNKKMASPDHVYPSLPSLPSWDVVSTVAISSDEDSENRRKNSYSPSRVANVRKHLDKNEKSVHKLEHTRDRGPTVSLSDFERSYLKEQNKKSSKSKSSKVSGYPLSQRLLNYLRKILPILERGRMVIIGIVLALSVVILLDEGTGRGRV